jgi:beta-galactosidase
MQKYPPLAHDDGTPDERAYHGLFDPFYRGAFDAGLQVRVVHARQLVGGSAEDPAADPAAAVTRHPVLVVPGLYLADDATLDWLLAYAAAGGHLVLGPRTAYADHEGRARTDVQPARLSEAAGVWYDEFSNLSGDLPVLAAGSSPLTVPAGSAGTRWVDGLEVEGADVLAHYNHPHFGRWPAITTREHGAGRITYVGTLPNQALARALFDWLAGSRKTGWPELPESVTATGANAPDGRRVRFVHNWSQEPAVVRVPVAARDALSGESLASGSELRLGAWDVRVLEEVAPQQ